MIDWFRKRFAGRSNAREIRKLEDMVAEVNALKEEMSALTAGEMAARTEEFRRRLAGGETEDDLLPEAFALAREAAGRTTGMFPFDVQVLGGIVLHQGRIAEMKTGEGKTLVATMPAYLNAISGRGVHIVTVNDYLARRDSEWMGPIYRLLGLKVGLVVHDMDPEEKKNAYNADIVYGTNNELGFDYLRDNMVIYRDQLMQRELNFAIVDEVDSILIDEARTPLIISSRIKAEQGYERWNKVVSTLMKKQWQMVNDALNRAREHLDRGENEEAGELILMARRGAPRNKKLLKMLKEPGIEKLVERVKHRLMSEKSLHLLDGELFFSIDEITRNVDISPRGYDKLAGEDRELKEFLGYGQDKDKDEDAGIGGEEEESGEGEEGAEEEEMARQRGGEHEFTIRALFKGYSLYERDVDYVIKDNQVIIVDEFTGRLMPGRRYSEGLHQALEAKENVAIQDETRTVASITFQNFFRMYNKLSGMTGTAATEEKEFRDIYGMDVVTVPTNMPMIRGDHPDVIYKTEEAKFNAVVEEIIEFNSTGQPLLVGTISVEKSERLSRMLKRRGVRHNVLNAVNHAREAEIISQAGQKGAVTISTNMAGRGTDIVLGGNYEYLAREKVHRELAAMEEESPQEYDLKFAARLREILPGFKARWEEEHEEVIRLGGLHVIGTERHESRRIDNQLRGRAGRQGDPGSSQFFISLEDDLMRLFGGGNIAPIMDRLGMEEDMPIDHPLISRAIENAQKKVEYRNFEIRKHLLEYDLVLNEQRKVIYESRHRALQEENIKDSILEMIREVVSSSFDRFCDGRPYLGEEAARELLGDAQPTFLYPGAVSLQDLKEREGPQAKEYLLDRVLRNYENREKEIESNFGPGSMRELERVVLLRTVDRHWVEHIDAMHDLRHEVGNRAYAQRDPLVEYRIEASRAYEFMLNEIQENVVRGIFMTRIGRLPRRERIVSSPTEVRPGAGGSRPGSFRDDAGADAPDREEGKPQPIKVGKKVGRNEPCPCGSGKKYKKCCGRNG